MNEKSRLSITSPIFRYTLTSFLGVFSGILFTYIVGLLDSADYLVEQWSIWIIEVPFIVFWAVFDRKNGWKTSISYALIGALFSFVLSLPDNSIAPVVYLKCTTMGIILGEVTWCKGSFTRRLTTVALPGVVIALFLGIPLILHGVSPEVMERFRQDSLEMYQVFMTEDDALNAADNAMQMFRGIFKAGLGFFLISSLVYAWMSFHGAKLMMGRFKEESEYIAPFYLFKLPFHAIWLFLGGFGLLLSEYEPLFPIALNVFVVMAFLYLIQGLAIVIYYMNRFSLGLLPRVIFWLFFFVTLLFSSVFLVFAGVIDSWFTLRSTPSNQDQNANI